MEFKMDQKVKVKREEDDMDSVDFGASGLVIHSNLKRFGPYLDSVLYYMGELKELPEWCVVGTSKVITSSTKHYMIRKENIEDSEELEV